MSDKLPFSWLAAIRRNLVIGFSGKDFVIYDYNTRKSLLEIDCSGGHRSWDFLHNQHDFVFAYARDKTINVVCCDRTSLSPISFATNFHISEVNAAIRINEFLISGGEDTTLRIGKFAANELQNVSVLKSHLSSIRTITCFRLDAERYLVFSAGGRSQIISWELDSVCVEKCSYYEPQEVETRIMDLCVISLAEKLLLLAACSDGLVKVFNASDNLNLLGQFFYKTKCLTKITHLRIANFDFVATMATDGKVVFWNFQINCISKLSPVFEVQSHQSGINSFSHKMVSANRCLFLTGGDDNKINLHLLKFSLGSIEILHTFCDISAHCAQITGTFMGKKCFLTTSIDQRLSVFTWEVCGQELRCEFVKRFDLDVPDIQGMCCCEFEHYVDVVVYGKGVQVCRIMDV